jgi:hypothetical protein
MNRRTFEDEKGNIWIVTRKGSTLEVKGDRSQNLRLHEIAKSCARKLGITQTKSGVPLQYINEHRRIWQTIWDKGQKS